MAPRPRPGILDIAAYVGGEQALAGVERPARLASNENPLGCSPRAAEAYRRQADQLHRYPDGSASALREAIGKTHGLDPDRIVCGAGSDELIQILARTYAGPGDEVLHSRHGFLMYAIAAQAAGAKAVAAPETDLTADVDALVGLAGPRTRLIFLANPNNPTGSYLSADAIRRLRERLPEDALLVIDAAYAEYVERNDYEAGAMVVDGGDNVVMTRTFSKIHGLAALRLGWAYCPPAVADALNRVRGPFNVSAPAQAAGIAALADREFVDLSRRHNAYWLPWLSEQVTAAGLKPYPSVGNFVLIRFPADRRRDAEAALKFLNERGILPRRMSAYGLPDCLRISIGSDDDNRRVAAALAEFMT